MNLTFCLHTYLARNSVPPNVPGVIIAMQPIVPSCHLFAQIQHYNVCITAAAVYGFCQT